MRFNLLFPLAAASLALASPSPEPITPQDPGLLTELPTILTGAEQLLSQGNVDNLNLIIGNAAKLLSDNNLAMLQDIVTNAHSLLTKNFVDNTTTLVTDATPVCASLQIAGILANPAS